MAIRLTVEGEECKVEKYLRHIRSDKNWKYYLPHEFLISATEKKVEYYVDESRSRVHGVEKNRLAKVRMETSDGEEIIFYLLDVKQFDLNDGKITILGKSYDIYTDPLPTT
jgi:hypothetical protein